MTTAKISTMVAASPSRSWASAQARAICLELCEMWPRSTLRIQSPSSSNRWKQSMVRHPTMAKSLCSTIHNNNDATWKGAVWSGIRRGYWDSATNWAAKNGLNSAYSKGFLFDVVFNHGAEVIDQLAKKTGQDPNKVSEKDFMIAFMSARAALITSGSDNTNGGQTDRVKLWNSILSKDNLQLKRPSTDLKCYCDMFQIKA